MNFEDEYLKHFYRHIIVVTTPHPYRVYTRDASRRLSSLLAHLAMNHPVQCALIFISFRRANRGQAEVVVIASFGKQIQLWFDVRWSGFGNLVWCYQVSKEGIEMQRDSIQIVCNFKRFCKMKNDFIHYANTAYGC